MYKKRVYITSSEIGQYTFCSLAWYWNKIGIELDSEKKNVGIEKHIGLGENIDLYKKTIKSSKLFLIFAIISLLLIIIWILF